MNTTLIGKILFFILAGAGLVLGVMAITKPTKNPEIDIIKHTLDSLKIENRKLMKNDSIFKIQVDSMKNSLKETKKGYDKTKEGLDKFRKSYIDGRNDIFLPNL